MKKSKPRQDDPRFAPPASLSPRAAAIWRSVAPRRCRSPERLELLKLALEARDRADEALRQRGDCLTIKVLSTGTVRAHPLLAVEDSARREFYQIWRALNLEWSTEIDGRLGDFDDPDAGRADVGLDAEPPAT